MKRILLSAAVLAFFWPYWAQQVPRYYYPRPANQPAQTVCPNGRCCVGGRCWLSAVKPSANKELPAPPKMAGDVPEVK